MGILLTKFLSQKEIPIQKLKIQMAYLEAFWPFIPFNRLIWNSNGLNFHLNKKSSPSSAANFEKLCNNKLIEYSLQYFFNYICLSRAKRYAIVLSTCQVVERVSNELCFGSVTCVYVAKFFGDTSIIWFLKYHINVFIKLIQPYIIGLLRYFKF